MRIKNIAKIWLLVTISIFNIDAVAQVVDTIEIQRNVNSQKIEFAKFSHTENPNLKLQNGESFLKLALRAKSDDNLQLIKTETDELGYTHQRFQQYYKGIKVEGAEYLLHSKDGYIQIINGYFADIYSIDVNPGINSSAALFSALKTINAKMYQWKNTTDPSYPKATLVICKEQVKDVYHLTWKFTIVALDPFLAEDVYIDAKNGNIINRISLIMDGNAAGTGATRYTGTQNITTDAFANSYRLREVQNSVTIQTQNFNHNTDANNISIATDFVDNDNNWTAAEWNNANKDNAALDAHWGAEKVYNYWRTIFNRNSIDGNGLAIKSYVHLGTGYDNAFWWSGTQSMYYGDGSIKFKPLPALDVCAHEFGHGICQYTAALVYQGESGALNEGFSDIWGASVEYWAAPTKQTWLIGEEVMLYAAALGSLQNPNQFGQPDTYLGTNWASTSSAADHGGVHTNSGVLNYWYYLISQGGSGTNDIGNAFKVNAIGIDKAQRIAYRAESVYLTSSANYPAARTACIQAARDLYGSNSC